MIITKIMFLEMMPPVVVLVVVAVGATYSAVDQDVVGIGGGKPLKLIKRTILKLFRHVLLSFKDIIFLVIKMKKTLIIIGIALTIGSFFGFMVIHQLNNNIETVFYEIEEVTVFQLGVFSSEENARRYAKSQNSGIVVKEDEFYRVYSSILKDEESVKIMQKHYDKKEIKYLIRKINIKDSNFLKELDIYQQLMKKATKDTTYDAVNKKILESYKEIV